VNSKTIDKLIPNRFLARPNRIQVLELLTIIFAFAASIVILFFYRRGGVVDAVYGPENSPGFRDTGIYVRAAEQLLSKESPYSNTGLSFRSGSFGVLIFGLLPIGSITYICYQVLNLVGILMFCKVFLRGYISQDLHYVTLALGICFSCVREIFSTGQITGILAGLVAVGFQGLRSERVTARLGGAFLFALALDLKPNLIIFFLLGSFIFLGMTRHLWMPFFILLIGHLAIDIYVGQFLEREWLATLMTVSDPTRDPSNTGTRTVWPLIKSLFGIEIIPSQIPAVVFITLGSLLLYFISRTRSYFLLFLTLIVPAFYNYFHLYSFYPFAIMVFAITLRRSMPISLGIMLPFLLVSGGHFGLSQLFFCLVLTSLLSLFLILANSVSHIKGFSQRFIVSAVLVSCVRFAVQFEIGSSWFQEVIILNCLVFAGIIIVLRAAVTKEKEFTLGRGGHFL
jgi:hypothetical protein